MKKTLSLLLFSFTIMLLPRANAQDLIDGGNPSEILAIAKGFGESNITIDDAGDPVIIGQIGDLIYLVYFYGCSEGKNCVDIELVSYIEFENPPSISKVNEWNRNYRNGNLYIDREDDLIFRNSIVVKGGVTRTALITFFQSFVTNYNAIERQFPEGVPARANVESLDDQDTSAQQYSDNINSELESYDEEEVSEFIEEFGVEALLSAIAKEGMEGYPDGYRLGEFTVIEKINAVGDRLYFYYLIDPEAKSYYDPESFSTNMVSEICGSKLMRHLFKEGAEVNMIFTYEGESKKFGEVVIDFQSCRESFDG